MKVQMTGDPLGSLQFSRYLLLAAGLVFAVSTVCWIVACCYLLLLLFPSSHYQHSITLLLPFCPLPHFIILFEDSKENRRCSEVTPSFLILGKAVRAPIWLFDKVFSNRLYWCPSTRSPVSIQATMGLGLLPGRGTRKQNKTDENALKTAFEHRPL